MILFWVLASSCLKICLGPNDFLMDLVLNNLDDVALMIFAKNLWIWKEAMSKSYHFFAYDHKQDWLPWAKIAPWVKFEMNKRKSFFVDSWKLFKSLSEWKYKKVSNLRVQVVSVLTIKERLHTLFLWCRKRFFMNFFLIITDVIVTHDRVFFFVRFFMKKL